jgi:hypothetical protein
MTLEAMAQHARGDTEAARLRLKRLEVQREPNAILGVAVFRHFTRAAVDEEAVLTTLFELARADPLKRMEAYQAAHELLNSPFIDWNERREEWSRLSAEKESPGNWAAPSGKSVEPPGDTENSHINKAALQGPAIAEGQHGAILE